MSTRVKIKKRPRTPSTILGKDVPIGTYFTGTPKYHDASMFVRSFDSIIDLANPMEVWRVRNVAPGIEFDDYLPIEAVTIKEDE